MTGAYVDNNMTFCLETLEFKRVTDHGILIKEVSDRFIIPNPSYISVSYKVWYVPCVINNKQVEFEYWR